MYDISLEAFDVKKTAKSISVKAKEIIEKLVRRIKIIVKGITDILDKLKDDKIDKLAETVSKRGLAKDLGNTKIKITPVFEFMADELKTCGNIIMYDKELEFDNEDSRKEICRDLHHACFNIIRGYNTKTNIVADKHNVETLKKFGALNMSKRIDTTVSEYVKRVDDNFLNRREYFIAIRDNKNEIKTCNDIIKNIENHAYDLNCYQAGNEDDRPESHNDYICSMLSGMITMLENMMNRNTNNVMLIKLFARHMAKPEDSNFDGDTLD